MWSNILALIEFLWAWIVLAPYLNLHFKCLVNPSKWLGALLSTGEEQIPFESSKRDCLPTFLLTSKAYAQITMVSASP